MTQTASPRPRRKRLGWLRYWVPAFVFCVGLFDGISHDVPWSAAVLIMITATGMSSAQLDARAQQRCAEMWKQRAVRAETGGQS